jgi:hypothetical protein
MGVPLLQSAGQESDNASSGEHMKTIWPKLALLVLCVAALGFELWHFRSGSTQRQQSPGPVARKNGADFALLPASEIGLWSKYFAPSSHAEGREPTLGDINDVEADLAQITALSNTDSDPSRHIDSPRDYYRQYLAVSMGGKRKIYVNALCTIDQDTNWRKRLIVVADGGKCFWHAMYDVSTRKFSELSVNGRA